MSKTTKIVIGVIAIILIGGIWYATSKKTTSNNTSEENKIIKIGIITDLTGPAAYWGESTRIGAEIAKKELEDEGYKIDLKFEDYQLDAAKAMTSAQKLINIDNVDSIYAEFNPAAISVGSFMKNNEKLFVYDAAVNSPMEGNSYAYKTYLDYQAGCKEISKKFKDQGIEKIGMLKVNLEFGELCLAGIREVYKDEVYSEAYNLGDTDFKTQLLKLKNYGAGAIINVGFENDSLNTLKGMEELKMNIPYGTVDDTITDNVKQKYPNQLKGALAFGFDEINPEFLAKADNKSGKKLSSYYGAAITYTHVKQIGKALGKCDSDSACVIKEMDNSAPDSTIGFKKFNNRIADLEMSIKQY